MLAVFDGPPTPAQPRPAQVPHPAAHRRSHRGLEPSIAARRLPALSSIAIMSSEP